MRAWLAAACLLACSPPGGASTSFGGPGGPPADAQPASEDSTAAASSSTGAASSSSDASSSTGANAESAADPSLPADTGLPPDFGPTSPPGCLGKIDFLFVISDSEFTAPYQDRLIAAYPEFMKTIAAEFPAFDAHILVTTPDNHWGHYECDDCLWCGGCACEAGGPGYPCGMGPQLTECDTMFGAGVTFPAGFGATNHRCDLGGGRRYITADTPDPAAAFECVARLGTSDGGGRVVDAMFAALADGINSPYGCNTGFFRDDALLVVTLISEWGDYASDLWPFTWSWTLSELKHYQQDAFVVLAIEDDRGDPNGVCKPFDDDWDLRLHEFADSVAHGVKGSLCADDYAPYFAEAAALALQQCEAFVPG